MSAETQEIAVEQIHLNDETYQGRFGYDESKLENLTSDIEEYGQRDPVGVRPNGDGYQLIYGFHRTKAARRLEWDSIDAKVYKDISDREALELAVRDNEMHEDLSQVEKARQAKDLKENGWSVNELCEAFNAKKSAVYNWLKVTELEDKYLGLIHEGYLSLYHGVELAKLETDSRRMEMSLLALSLEFSVRELQEWIEWKQGRSGRMSPVFYGRLGPSERGFNSVPVCPLDLSRKYVDPDCQDCPHFEGVGENEDGEYINCSGHNAVDHSDEVMDYLFEAFWDDGVPDGLFRGWSE